MVVVAIMLLVAVVSSVVCLYFYRKFYAHQLFLKEGIPGPKPHWLLGNVKEFADESTRHLVLYNWTKKYGKIFGYYEGSKPTLVTSDPEIVTQVFVKQFPIFHARKRFPIQEDPNADTEGASMFLAYGDRWKRLRTTVNPNFSAAKMRALTPLMNKCQGDFMFLIDKMAAEGKAFDIFECYKFLTLDTISETAFGIELNSARSSDKNNVVLETITEMFRNTFNMPLSMQIATILPETSRILRNYEYLRGKLFGSGLMKTQMILTKLITEVVESRKGSAKQQNRQDLLQMLIEAESPEDVAALSKEAGVKGLTTHEVIGQAILFMIAGYETSSNALACCSFLLANNPHVQDKLIAEIDENFPATSKKPVDYDSVYDLPYLEAVINETLRLFPIAPLIINRMAVEDTIINGIRIPEGLPIAADVWSIHRDEEQWGPVDPEAFHPERFLDDYPTKQSRSDAAFMPFGFGPRICIGMRFALLEIKLTLVNLLRKYRVEKCERTGEKLPLKAAFTITPSCGVWIKLAKRV